MAQTLTDRVKAILNTPGTGENVNVAEVNSAFSKFDNHFIPACKIRHTGSQIIASGVGQVLLTYDATVFDSYAARSEGAMADLANDRIVIRKNGLYHVRANTLANAGSVGMLRLDMAINGGTSNSNFDTGQTATATSQEINAFLPLVSGDLITTFFQQTTGANRTLTDNTYPNVFTLEAIWLGNTVEV